MLCKKCGAETGSDRDLCPACEAQAKPVNAFPKALLGTIFSVIGMVIAFITKAMVENGANLIEHGDDMEILNGTMVLLFGALLTLAGLAFSVIALVFGIISVCKFSAMKRAGDSRAVATLVLGIVAIAVGAGGAISGVITDMTVLITDLQLLMSL